MPCEEVAPLRRDVELAYRQGQEAPVGAGPDYSPTLGAIAKELTGVAARLDALERAPALAATPAAQVVELRSELHARSAGRQCDARSRRSA